MNNINQVNNIISQKYKIIKLLGEGGVGKTYEAEDLNTSQKVAIKIVALRQVKDWKILELFEREAKILAFLEHPNIPKYIEYFHIDTDENRYFYLVRELVTGDSLFDLVQQGWRVNEEDVKQIAIQILKILQYLHQQTSPIIHRDIKPQNLIRSENGQIYLVDFGSVQEVYRQSLSGNSTFVGTLGYMPPEQLRGQTSLASDLYSLGATLIFLLTKTNPDSLPQQRMKINFRSVIKISDKFANWLDKILNPIAEERFQSVEEALDTLYSENKFPQPPKSRVILNRTNNSLEIEIPLKGLDGNRFSKDNIYSGLITLGINIIGSYFFFLFYIAFLEVSQGIIPLAGLAFIVFISPFWLVILSFLGAFIFQNFGYIYISINQQNFQVSKHLWGLGISQRGETKKILKIEGESSNYEIRGYNLVYCAIKGEKEVHFGVGITPDEKEWIAAEIRDFIEDNKQKKYTDIN